MIGTLKAECLTPKQIEELQAAIFEEQCLLEGSVSTKDHPNAKPSAGPKHPIDHLRETSAIAAQHVLGETDEPARFAISEGWKNNIVQVSSFFMTITLIFLFNIFSICSCFFIRVLSYCILIHFLFPDFFCRVWQRCLEFGDGLMKIHEAAALTPAEDFSALLGAPERWDLPDAAYFRWLFLHPST